MLAQLDKHLMRRIEVIAARLIGVGGIKEDFEDLVSVGKIRILEMEHGINPKHYINNARYAMITYWKKERLYRHREIRQLDIQ